jgi:hypothetical protein
VVIDLSRHVRVHAGLVRVAAPSRQFAAQHGGEAKAVFALGDQVRNQGPHVPFGALGGPLPVEAAESAEQLERCLAFGFANQCRLVAVG